ncbi:hypothetical protein TcCL_NonESM07775 [Trypanosoma cruzi]|nr:hypothetical protein TcCL_NonESM07775 [Trypanosoma cruzi]
MRYYFLLFSFSLVSAALKEVIDTNSLTEIIRFLFYLLLFLFTRPMGPSCNCSMLISLLISALLGSYLVYLIVWVPVYRYTASIIVLLLLAFNFSAWRFLPSERAYVRERAKDVVNERLAFTAPTAVA